MTATRTVCDVFPCADGHAQERSLLHLVLLTIRKDELWLADRNFCVRSFLFGIWRRNAKFVIRHHANLPYEVVGKRVSKGRTETGQVFEEPVEIHDPDTGETLRLRLITLVLDQPTRDKEREIRLLTNLSASDADARKVAELYRQRWTIESMFQELTQHLSCEIRTLAYPQAAMFAFCLALTAWNLVSTITASLAAVHGEALVDHNVSGFYLSLEISQVTPGMMIAIPQKHWSVFQTIEAEPLAKLLKELASHADLKKYQSHPRGPKKPRPQRHYSGNGKHVATARILCRQT